MLTKEERAAIAERLKSTEYITSSTLFRALTGEEKPSEMSNVKSLCIICSVILGLCDTSNMLELPLDKDGKVIRIGDIVYANDKSEHTVSGYTVGKNSTVIVLDDNYRNGYMTASAEDLMHKKPVTIASLIEQIRRVIDEGEMTSWSMDELFDIAEQLESLGDSDD